MKIKKGDTVLIISGKDRGRKAKVIAVSPKKRKIAVEGVNLKKKHIKPKKAGEKGQIVEVAGFFDASNAKVVCSKCGKPTRVGYRIEEKRKYRICRKCGQEI